MVMLSKLVVPDRVILLGDEDKPAALDRLAGALSESPEVDDPQALAAAIHDREAVLSTGIGVGLAVPHAKIPAVKDVVVAIGVSKAGIEYGSIDDQPVHIIVMVGAGAHQQADYLKTLARVVLVLKNPKVRAAILDADTAEAVHDIIGEY